MFNLTQREQPIDQHQMLNILDRFYEQCHYALSLAANIKIKNPIKQIVIAGMGGSATAGDIVNCYIKGILPFYFPRTYELPKWVNKDALVFVVSYSGNTEETLCLYEEAKRRGCSIVVISSGGKLKDKALREQVPHIEVPPGLPPREAIGYQALPMLIVLENSGLIPKNKDFLNLVGILKANYKAQAKDIAKRLINRTPLIYSSETMYCIARIWKIKMNENAKIQAFCNVIPEMNHTEIEGFNKILTDYFVLILEDEEDDARIKRRMEITKEILQEKGLPVLIIKITGKNRLARILSSLLLAGYVSYYLALSYNTDPFPFPTIEAFKKRLEGEKRIAIR